MSIRQSGIDSIRYMKRKSLEEESRIIGNYYKDIIKSYGIDVNYYKHDTSLFQDFKGIIDKNTILKHAYGYDISPDYSCSASMISFMETEADIFQLQKIGGIPNETVNFYFDSKQFACDLACKCGVLKEYKIDEKEIICEVPDKTNDFIMIDDGNGNQKKHYLSTDVFPYKLGLGYQENYTCGILSGKLSVEINDYKYNRKMTTICHPYEHTEFNVLFDANDDLYRSFKYKIENDQYVDTLIYLDYKVKKVIVEDEITGKRYKNVLTGKIHGSILFYDLNETGKYLKLIHPEVGDIITIDFPDSTNREQFEITECFDKSLQSDGISPLLHKYIWKCKARRYIDNGIAEVEHNEANDRLEEKLTYDQVVSEEIAKKISIYDEGDQEAYGGYDGTIHSYDKQIPNPNVHEKYDYLNDTECLDIMNFECGSKLVTNGYDLIFVDSQKNGYLVAKTQNDPIVQNAIFECGLRWLKASKESIVFISIEGESTRIVEDELATSNEIQLCLNDLNEKTLDSKNINNNSENFLKFKGCRSYIWATENNLYAKLESNNQLYKLI